MHITVNSLLYVEFCISNIQLFFVNMYFCNEWAQHVNGELKYWIVTVNLAAMWALYENCMNHV